MYNGNTMEFYFQRQAFRFWHASYKCCHPGQPCVFSEPVSTSVEENKYHQGESLWELNERIHSEYKWLVNLKVQYICYFLSNEDVPLLTSLFLFTDQQELYHTCLEGAYHEIDIFQEQDMSLLSLKILYLWISQNPQRRTNQYYSKVLNSQLEVISTLWYLRSAFHNLEMMMLLIECIHLLALCFLCYFLFAKFLFSICGRECGVPEKRENYPCLHLEFGYTVGPPHMNKFPSKSEFTESNLSVSPTKLA